MIAVNNLLTGLPKVEEYEERKRDWREDEWEDAVEESEIRVLMYNGVARVIFVGNRRFEITRSDLTNLLLFIIERSAQHQWTTIREAQLHIDGSILTSRDRSLGNCKARIAKLFPNMLQKTKETADGSPAYRLNAPIAFIEQKK